MDFHKASNDATAVAAVLPPLMLQAVHIAATIEQGVHGRRRTGRGDSFWQFRPYYSGDDIRRVDWRQSAKSDRLFLRQTEWDAAQSAYLWCDLSPSMRYASERRWPEKRDRALLLCLGLGHLLIRAGERIAWWDGDNPPASGSGAIERLTAEIAAARTAKELPDPGRVPAHAHVVMLSDFLVPLGELAQLVHALADRDVRGHMVAISDPGEDTFPFAGRIRFLGFEGEKSQLFGKSENLKDEYLAKLRAHREGLRQIARNAGWGMSVHRTDRPALEALLEMHASLADAYDRRGMIRGKT
ncbi:MAG TPA: DUF58 domain-containing protein [Dongiaceae bacterium]|jgi:uncharacterized protein (DUF58 family)|nr:DUF58 domain-containing protein [Dongiaceae bacterium]